MRIITDQIGLRVSAMEAGDNPAMPECSQYTVDCFAAHFELIFQSHSKELSSSGITEEAYLTVLLDRLQMLVRDQPCDDYRRALYHLVKAHDCFRHHQLNS